MEEQSENQFVKIKEQVTEYVNLQAEVAKLVAYEKISKISAVLASAVVLLFLLFFALLFIFFAAAYFFAGLFHSNALGFGMVALLYIILIVGFLAVRKKYFEKKITNSLVTILTTDDNDEQAG